MRFYLELKYFVNISCRRYSSTYQPKFHQVDSPLLKSIFTPDLLYVFKLFEKNNFQLKVAGGAVRDLLLNIVPHDVDLATNALPDQMVDMFSKENIRILNLNGLRHGTVPIRINDKVNYDITTLRIDVKTYGRQAEVAFTNDWHADAIRRDLTINSLFLDFDGKIIDYVDGVQDVKNKVVRFVGVPDKRVKEDYLRIMRYFRFFSRVSDDPNKHDAESIEAIKNNVQGLQKMSGERIWGELRQILSQRYADSIMKMFYEFNISKYIGLPDNGNVENLCREYQIINISGLNPVALLSLLCNNKLDIEKMNARLKFSSEDHSLLHVMFTYRDELKNISSESERLKRLTHLIAHPYANANKPLHILEAVELVKSIGCTPQTLDAIQQFKTPKFNIYLSVLLNHKLNDSESVKVYVEENKLRLMANRLLNELKVKWIESDFKLSSTDLLKLVDLEFLNAFVEKKKNKNAKK